MGFWSCVVSCRDELCNIHEDMEWERDSMLVPHKKLRFRFVRHAEMRLERASSRTPSNVLSSID